MKPQLPHIPSPTLIASSAFSTHPNDQFKQRAAAPLALSVDFRAVSRIHYDELHSFLTEYLAKGYIVHLHLPPCLILLKLLCSTYQLLQTSAVPHARNLLA